MMNEGGLYKLMGPGPIMNFAVVEDVDKVLVKAEKLGGTIVMPKNEIKNVGTVAVMQDTEKNILGLWEPMVK
jgi:predicted enzyme related to lactoylglutathione lyase